MDLTFTNFVAILENLNLLYIWLHGWWAHKSKGKYKESKSRSSTKYLLLCKQGKITSKFRIWSPRAFEDVMKQIIFIKESTLRLERDVNKKMGASLKKILWNYQAYRNRYNLIDYGHKENLCQLCVPLIKHQQPFIHGKV